MAPAVTETVNGIIPMGSMIVNAVAKAVATKPEVIGVTFGGKFAFSSVTTQSYFVFRRTAIEFVALFDSTVLAAMAVLLVTASVPALAQDKGPIKIGVVLFVLRRGRQRRPG